MINWDTGKNMMRKIILTFDDGPHPVWTERLLDLLYRYNMRVIFFVVGQKVKQYPVIVKKMIEQGHIIANHTWSHRILFAASPETLKREIYDYGLYMRENFNYTMKFFRPPWGIISKKIVDIIKNEFGYKLLLWNRDSLDYLLPLSRNINKLIASESQEDPQIILFHDGNILSPVCTRKHTLQTVEKLIELKKKNIEFILPDY